LLEAGNASTSIDLSSADGDSINQLPPKTRRKARIMKTGKDFYFGTRPSEELPSYEPVSPNSNDSHAYLVDYLFHTSGVQKELHTSRSDIIAEEALDCSKAGKCDCCV
jgi:hypothetical protein